ncbi:RNA polymerase-associated protein RTF1 [Pelomyxa schiedti]|nr:RNA polymerase-associated protein RTF1 [Pelomyxa schiedti]
MSDTNKPNDATDRKKDAGADKHHHHHRHHHHHHHDKPEEPSKKASSDVEEGEILDDRKTKKRKLATAGTGTSSPQENDPAESDGDYHDEWDDDLKGDAEDRKYLDSLSEIKREQVLAERYEQRKRNMERQRIRAERRGTTQPNKSKVEPKTPSKATERQLRDRTRKEASFDAALKAIKQKRAKLESTATSSSEKHPATQSSSTSSSSSTTSTSTTTTTTVGSDTEEKEPQSSPHQSGSPSLEIVPPSPPSPPHNETSTSVTDPDIMTLAQMQEIQLPRSLLIKWVNEPFFEKAVKKAFVRVSLGIHLDKKVYRIAVVIGLHKGKTYSLDPSKRGPTYETNIHLVLQTSQSDSSKTFPLSSISEQPFTATEYDFFTRHAIERRVQSTYLSQQVFSDVRDNLQWAKAYKYSEDDYRLKEIRAKEKAKPIKKAAIIQSQLEEAQMDEDHNRVTQLQMELANLRETEGKNEAILYPKKPSRLVVAENDGSASSGALNPCQRRKTVPEVFVPPSSKSRQQKAATGSKGHAATPTSSTTTPTSAAASEAPKPTTTTTPAQPQSQSQAPASAPAPTPASASPATPTTPPKPLIQLPPQEDYAESMMKAHDFELDIDVSKVESSTTAATTTTSTTNRTTPPRILGNSTSSATPAAPAAPVSSGLSMADYKRLRQKQS